MTHILTILLFLTAVQSRADVAFTSLTDSDMAVITKALSSNSLHMSNTGAAGYGRVFGFELGLAAGQTGTSDLNTVVQNADPSATVDKLYNAGIVAGVTIPFGFTFEAVVVPTAKGSGAEYSGFSGALKYNLNSLVPVLPVNLSARGIYSTSTFKFDQIVSSVANSVENKNKVTGIQLIVSPMLPIIEPYLGVGFLSGEDELTTNASSIFDSSLTTGLSYTKKESTTQVFGGVVAKLALFSIGLEYSKAFDNSRVSAKLGFGL